MPTLSEKFENINLEAIPENLRFELEAIREETGDFKDEDAIEIFTKNFNYLYSSIEKKHPTALKDYTPPPPTPAEIAAEIAKQEKIANANALLNKHKKAAEKPVEVESK